MHGGVAGLNLLISFVLLSLTMYRVHPSLYLTVSFVLYDSARNVKTLCDLQTIIMINFVYT